jgi:carboxyl-terminal processing protease
MKLLARVGIVLGALSLLAIGTLGGVILDREVLSTFSPPAGLPANAEQDFALISEAWNLIEANYVDQEAVAGSTLVYGAINGMVAALGDTGHSRFQTPEMRRSEQIGLQGEFEGIGAWVDFRNGYVTIVAPFDGSPAEAAGLKPGDVVLAVDSEDMTGETLDAVIGRILGPAGTDVTLTIFRPETGDTKDYTITRDRIQIHNVTWQTIPGTNLAVLRISQFSGGVTDDVKTALGEMEAQHIEGVILDLRNNPGGLLDEAIGITSQFVSEGNVLLEQDARGNQQEIRVKPGGIATDLPMVVLINAGSASASEIVSGALQDAGRAQIVGQTTFGTGTVLQEFPLSDGSSLLLATQEWLTPNGRVIWHQGIVPDVTVDQPISTTLLVPDAIRDLSAEQLQATDDAQFLRALELLQQETAVSAR